MRALLAAMLYDKKFSEDHAYVAKRQEFAHMPGAFECTSASRLRAPFREARPYFGSADQTPYENVAVPDPIIEKKRERIILTGDVPSPINPPSGCSFHPRCPFAEKICAEKEPLLAYDGGHGVACHVFGPGRTA